ncbi:hypothetical protein, partial [Morganella sp. GD04133]|uniref:hypothetical protein n=1 Tax=Morganella sp. GD04133 TaxID=2975435 RepID=UPI002448563E
VPDTITGGVMTKEQEQAEKVRVQLVNLENLSRDFLEKLAVHFESAVLAFNEKLKKKGILK